MKNMFQGVDEHFPSKSLAKKTEKTFKPAKLLCLNHNRANKFMNELYMLIKIPTTIAVKDTIRRRSFILCLKK